MKVKDIDALREQISHDPREVFTKHQVWLLVSEHNKTTPTFDAVPKSVLENIKAEINFGTNQGWECPKCGRVYAPWMSSCTNCGVDNINILTTNVSERDNHISRKEKE